MRLSLSALVRSLMASTPAPFPCCHPQHQLADLEARLQRAEESFAAAEAEVAALRQRLAVAGGAVWAWEREVEEAVNRAQADGAGLRAKVGA